MSSQDLGIVRQYLHAVSTVVEVAAAIDSTNNRAMHLAETGSPHGTVVWADTQQLGRGRHGRSWHSPSGRNVYLSVILRPTIHAAIAPQFTLDAALAVARAIEQYAAVPQLRLKWPNDLVTLDSTEPREFKKIAGILTELRTKRNGVDALVVGIGLNIGRMNPNPAAPNATSMLDVCTDLDFGSECSLLELRAKVSASLVSQIIDACASFAERGRFARDEWQARALSFGRKVQVSVPGHSSYVARTADVDAFGRLQVQRGDALETIVAGDVTYLGG